MSPSVGPPSDWVSGERVFAPPSGTFDVDWLVGAVLEAVPGTTPAQAREALLDAWRDIGTPGGPAAAASAPVAGTPGAGTPALSAAGASAGNSTVAPASDDPLTRVARQVADEARRSFRA